MSIPTPPSTASNATAPAHFSRRCTRSLPSACCRQCRWMGMDAGWCGRTILQELEESQIKGKTAPNNSNPSMADTPSAPSAAAPAGSNPPRGRSAERRAASRSRSRSSASGSSRSSSGSGSSRSSYSSRTSGSSYSSYSSSSTDSYRNSRRRRRYSRSRSRSPPFRRAYSGASDSYRPRPPRARSASPPPPKPRILPDRLSLYPLSKNVSRAHLFEIIALFIDSPPPTTTSTSTSSTTDATTNYSILKSLSFSTDAGTRRTATIEFHTEKDVDSCFEGLDGACIDGLDIKVTRSKAPIIEERTSGAPRRYERSSAYDGRRGGRFNGPSGGRGGYNSRRGAGGDSYSGGGERRGGYDRDNRDRDYGRRPPPRDYDSRARSPPRESVGGLAGRGGRGDRSRSPNDRRR
ncbi:hypothetical protein BDR26DRAFT_206504 [Obelidium mucronatum]|nr:hypothetical protein BDR26DRAFT_206504 [Obelidium mucronatum]